MTSLHSGILTFASGPVSMVAKRIEQAAQEVGVMSGEATCWRTLEVEESRQWRFVHRVTFRSSGLPSWKADLVGFMVADTERLLRDHVIDICQVSLPRPRCNKIQWSDRGKEGGHASLTRRTACKT